MPVTIDGSSGLTANNGSVFTNASGNVGIGTSSPFSFGTGSTVLDIKAQASEKYGALFLTSHDAAIVGEFFVGQPGGNPAVYLGTRSNHALQLVTNNTERMRIASNGAQSSVIPGGTTLYPEFKCRAWVNFNGTGTVAIRASGNVSSITDNGTGIYTVNFTTAMPDANYAVVGMGNEGALTTAAGATMIHGPQSFQSTGSVQVRNTSHNGTAYDGDSIRVSVFR
jgi:hypothetical protein